MKSFGFNYTFIDISKTEFIHANTAKKMKNTIKIFDVLNKNIAFLFT